MIKKLFGILLLASYLVSCEEDKVDYGYGAYYVELATVVSQDSFLLDNGTTLVSEDFSMTWLVPGRRICLVFSYLNNDTSATRRSIKVIGYSSISSGEVQAMPEDQIITDPVKLESVWLGGRYLNLSFSMNYKSQTHTIGLAYLGYDDEQKKERFRFSHNENGDSPGYQVKVVLSFDMTAILGEPRQETSFSVNINSSNYGDKEYEFVY